MHLCFASYCVFLFVLFYHLLVNKDSYISEMYDTVYKYKFTVSYFEVVPIDLVE